MYNIEFLEYETNKSIATYGMLTVPRTGEFIILEKSITDNWKDHFYIVRAVSYTIGLHIMVHIEKLNHAELIQRDQKIKEAVKNLVDKAKEKQNDTISK